MAASMKVTRFMQIGLWRPLLGLNHSFSKCCCLRQRSLSSLTSTKTWQLHSSVLLQRPPVVSVELNEFEQKYADYLNEVEINMSNLSDHELYDRKIKAAQKEAAAEKKADTKGIQVKEVLLTAEEQEDEWRKERDQFKLADRITDADRNGDLTSPHRKLEERLYLVVNQKFSEGGKPVWILPQIQRQEGESMRQAAERALRTHCGDDVSACFLGNAPCAYTKYKLPRDTEEYGVKVFVFKADYHGGNVVPNKSSVDAYKWLTLSELRETLSPKDAVMCNDVLSTE